MVFLLSSPSPSVLSVHRAQFARRDHLSHKPGIRAHDALIITCTITGSPERPTPPPAVPRLPVPKDLLDSFGALLDDPVYSDVEFVLPRRNGSLRASKRIFAMKKILKRYDYFDTSRWHRINARCLHVLKAGCTVFGSGFQEASTDRFDFFPDQDGANDRDSMSDNISEVTSLGGRGDDSDEEDEESEDEDARTDLGIDSSVPPTTESSEDEGVRTPLIEHSDVQSDDPPLIARVKVPEPPTPQSSRIAPTRGRTGRPASVQHIQPPRMRVVVRDVAYSTYKAVLYYVRFYFVRHRKPRVADDYPAVHRHHSLRTLVVYILCNTGSCTCTCAGCEREPCHTRRRNQREDWPICRRHLLRSDAKQWVAQGMDPRVGAGEPWAATRLLC